MELSSSSIVGGQIQQPHACRGKGGTDQPLQLTVRGLPIVKLDCEFKAPSRMGERLMLSLSVSRVGNSSITLQLRASAGGELRVLSTQVLVTTSLDSNKAIAIPEDLRRLL